MQNESFKEIDVALLPWSCCGIANKSMHVRAEPVPEGYALKTVMQDGHVETCKTAGPNDFKVTNPDGEQYLISGEKLAQRYSDLGNGNYAPRRDPVTFLIANENVSFKAPWGEEMRIKAGGALVNLGGGDIYGIQPDEFKKTYQVHEDFPASYAWDEDSSYEHFQRLVALLGADRYKANSESSRQARLEQYNFLNPAPAESPVVKNEARASHVIDMGADLLQAFDSPGKLNLSMIMFDRPFPDPKDFEISKEEVLALSPIHRMLQIWGPSMHVELSHDDGNINVKIKDFYGRDAENLDITQQIGISPDRVVSLRFSPEGAMEIVEISLRDDPLDSTIKAEKPADPFLAQSEVMELQDGLSL